MRTTGTCFLPKGLFTWKWGTPGKWGNPLRWGKTITLLYMQSYNPPSRGALSQDYWMVVKHVNKKYAGKPRVLAKMLFNTHLLLLLQPSVLWLSIVSFNNDSKPPPKWILREFDVSRIRPRLAWVSSPWNVDMAKFDLSWEGYLVWQTGLPILKGDPTYHVNVIKLKWEIIWTGGVFAL